MFKARVNCPLCLNIIGLKEFGKLSGKITCVNEHFIKSDNSETLLFKNNNSDYEISVSNNRGRIVTTVKITRKRFGNILSSTSLSLDGIFFDFDKFIIKDAVKKIERFVLLA